jgi:pimeloyl-ACP methyl ester carboxylesterase
MIGLLLPVPVRLREPRAKAVDVAVRWQVAWALIAVVVVMVGCAHQPPAPPQQNRPPRTLEPQFDGAPVLPPPDMTDDGPGSLVEVKRLPDMVDLDQVNATAVRVVYRSTEGDHGAATEVSGVVVVPPGKPPNGGWPILSVGHSQTGVLNQCAPSLASDLGGYAAIIALLVPRGYVVAMTDYQGLGLAGFHHLLLDATTLGNNVIDAARAARRVLPTASTRWAAYGTGQGGMAAWAASERAASYGRGMEMAGAVALSPFADMSGLADAAENGTLPREQFRLLALVLDSLASSPAKLDLDEYRSSSAKDRWDALTACALADPAGELRVMSQLQAADLRPHSEAAAAELRRALAQSALPGDSTGPVAPIFVAYASDDPFVPAAWVERALRAACIKGEPIEVMKRIGDTNTSNEAVNQAFLDWLQGRFEDQRAANFCQGVA